jgi:hypothetical protein
MNCYIFLYQVTWLVRLYVLVLIVPGMISGQEPANTPPAIPELARLEGQFDKDVHEKVDAGYKAEIQKLSNAYRLALDTSLKRLAAAGQLDEAVAVKEELKNFTASGTVPDTDEPKTGAEVLRLRKAWRTDWSRLQKQRSFNLKPLIEAHLGRLRQLELALTHTLKLEEAKLVREKRETLAKSTIDSGLRLSPPSAPIENLMGARLAQRMDLYASGNNGCIIRINGKEIMTVKRDKASKTRVGLREGDVIAVRLSDRFDINSFWLSCIADTGEFLFETSEQWTSYLPLDTGKWWNVKDAKEKKPVQFASDRREYVNLVKKSAATTPHYNQAQPICSVLSDGTRLAYVYYTVTKKDLLVKK